MSISPAFANVSEAMDMVQAGLSYLAAADAAQLATVTRALDCRRSAGGRVSRITRRRTANRPDRPGAP
jgi:hypothetical protein